MARILVVEDDTTFRSLLVTILEGQGYELVEREDGKAALMLLQRQQFDLVLSDLRLPGMGGLELYRQAKAKGVVPPFVLLTAFGTVEEAVAAIKEGVADFLTKPLKDPATLRQLVSRVLGTDRHIQAAESVHGCEPAGLPPDAVMFAGVVMEPLKRLIREVAPTQATVLITGESGTGKELVARMIHRLSNRSEGPFVALNCAAIPENLLESELFGHEKGAFTGATQTRQGKFELATGGTLFLDEIGEMPVSLQAKMLRVLQERTFERVGGQRELKADLRIVAATNRDLVEEVRQRNFREDLYYRLNVFPIHLPALRDRSDGIPVLVEYLAVKAAESSGAGEVRFEPGVIELFAGYRWPGNIRELQNVLERAVILGRGTVSTQVLPVPIQGMKCCNGDEPHDGRLRNIEKNAILEALASCGENRRLAAEKLGISKRTLQYRLKAYGLVE